MYISNCLEVTEPCRPPDGFIVEPLYGCRRSMGGTSFLARSGEVVCWRVRHLDAHRTWESRCRRVTWQVPATLRVRGRHRRSATGVLHFLWTRRVWCHSAAVISQSAAVAVVILELNLTYVAYSAIFRTVIHLIYLILTKILFKKYARSRYNVYW